MGADVSGTITSCVLPKGHKRAAARAEYCWFVSTHPGRPRGLFYNLNGVDKDIEKQLIGDGTVGGKCGLSEGGLHFSEGRFLGT